MQIETWWDFRDDVTFTTGNHAVKVGVASIWGPGREDLTGNEFGTWTFTADQNFNPDDPSSFDRLTNPSQYTASFPPVAQDLPTKWFQTYVQDDWRVGSRLTLNLGLRYDLQYRLVQPESGSVRLSENHPLHRSGVARGPQQPAATDRVCLGSDG